MTFFELLERTFLPALTMVLVVTAHMMRMTRAAIINLMASPYIEMARLKGVPNRKVITRHALPNALAPIINVIALNPTPLSPDRPPTGARVDRFVARVGAGGATVTLRDTRGKDIDAACGQLRLHEIAAPGNDDHGV